MVARAVLSSIEEKPVSVRRHTILSEENTSSEEATVDELLLICPRRRKSFRGQNICLKYRYLFMGRIPFT